MAIKRDIRSGMLATVNTFEEQLHDKLCDDCEFMDGACPCAFAHGSVDCRCFDLHDKIADICEAISSLVKAV